MKKMIKLYYLAFFLLLLSCNQQSGGVIDETPTRGNVKIACDESFKLLFDTEIYTFESLYKDAKINVAYLPENDLFNLFFKDSVRAIVTTRKLTKNEEDGLIGNNIIPKTTIIAYDALAFIINPKNTDSTIIYSSIKKIFTGEYKTWKDINPKSKLGDLAMVFDNDKSANVRYINEIFELKQGFPSTCSAVKSNEEVINYVEKNENAIGLISVNYISDRNDSLTINFLSRIKVLAISSETDDGSSGYYFRPYQAYIANVSYPFRRDVYIISRETFIGLASGFKQFVAGDVGQRIILKSGMVPSNMPIRLIQISTE
ncbi:MAG: phosphate ABC transporter substrate-binding protein, PhoT family [Bacteroidetes bacterium CG02_land_8_20_14_3_00_31_25]|nr:MAG: phosphate ABC transporter substrate-binding protein, PhoT family [Bacteroidetes bacterium CG02_land_8_20_14_3_00_31_25]PIX36460.1 MAG: phosphate ABC transporter substrate-binding protein, PhoT family [Bacteroidetes bacterium CG_4_8_14_3_um_filter_31_14]